MRYQHKWVDRAYMDRLPIDISQWFAVRFDNGKMIKLAESVSKHKLQNLFPKDKILGREEFLRRGGKAS